MPDTKIEYVKRADVEAFIRQHGKPLRQKEHMEFMALIYPAKAAAPKAATKPATKKAAKKKAKKTK